MKPKRSFVTENFSISQEVYDFGWTMPYTHYHDSYEIYILESGERIVTIEGRDYTTKKHDAVLFKKTISHTSRGETAFSGICIKFLDRFLDFYFTKNSKSLLLGCFNHCVITLTDDEFNKLKDIADNFVLNSPKNLTVFVSLMDILNTAAQNSSEPVLLSEQPLHSKSQMIIQYVDTNYRFINNIEDITNLFDVSESYIFKIFKQKHNTTPKHYIYNLKLKNACMWLKNRNTTIKNIAFNSGFDCYEYFIRLFKKEFGCTPSEYRKIHNKQYISD